VPVINGGDGVGEHPTQALLDLFTIIMQLGAVDGLTITLVGDLKHGRTVHSLAKLLVLFDVTVHYVSPDDLAMPADLVALLAAQGLKQHQHKDLQAVIQDTDGTPFCRRCTLRPVCLLAAVSHACVSIHHHI
jgi:aspartate carbamoyltransferase catalytic subunit